MRECVTLARADLYIPSAWATQFRRTDLWATAFDASDAISFYPIIGFRNINGASPTLSYWDGAAWVSLGAPAAYDTWYTLELRLSGGNVEYLVDNVVVGTVASGGSTYLGNIIMQAYNFNDNTLGASYDPGPDNSYDAFWDNLYTSGSGGSIYTDPVTGDRYCLNGAIVAASDVNNSSSDNCPGVTVSIDNGTFDCDDLGQNIVILTATDASNNTASCMAVVTVVDDGAGAELPG
ncbi:MAG: hypothetical protein IPM81_20400 [Saprospirales bacterium]|nr:hypothetical protein [Saprospirales bacterium]